LHSRRKGLDLVLSEAAGRLIRVCVRVRLNVLDGCQRSVMDLADLSKRDRLLIGLPSTAMDCLPVDPACGVRIATDFHIFL
jgi:hypothetical protein